MKYKCTSGMYHRFYLALQTLQAHYYYNENAEKYSCVFLFGLPVARIYLFFFFFLFKAECSSVSPSSKTDHPALRALAGLNNLVPMLCFLQKGWRGP